MGQLPNPKELAVRCDVCGSKAFHSQSVDEIFRIEDRTVLVEHIPARVCDRCGDASFDCQTVERVRRMIHDGTQPSRSVSVDVFAFV